MKNKNKFGKLIGVLEVGNSYCKFLVYASRNREILTCHELNITKIAGNVYDDDEYDPMELWDAAKEVIRIATENLIILEIPASDIIAVGVTNQRETSLLWNKKSGEVFNSISWCDSRLKSVENEILQRTKYKKNYLKAVCGLPFNVCFSAIKIKWLIENNKAVQEAIENEECYFGNLDSWILWNLTGGINNGVHSTDVTNASRTMLMNLETLSWDSRLCKFFNVPMKILPQIRSCSEIYGYINISGFNILKSIPIAAVIGDNNASLVGQLCLKAGQIECSIDQNCSILFNTGQEIIYSDNDLLSTVAYQLGPQNKVFYALEGFVGNAGTAVDWLKTSIIPEDNNNTPNVTTFLRMNGSGYQNFPCLQTEEELTFVPALKGLCAPKFLFQAKGFLSGLSLNTNSNNLLTAAKESIAFQTKTILNSLKKDCKTWPSISNIIVGGEFADSVDFLQLLADICSVTIERPHVSSTISMGCMLSAALTMKSLTFDDFRTSCIPPVDIFNPTVNPDLSDKRYMKWLTTLRLCIQVNEQCSREEVNALLKAKDSSRFISNSIPGCMYLFSSYVIYVLAQQWP
ncbi:unnamed protein product [Diamesa serratosioi]